MRAGPDARIADIAPEVGVAVLAGGLGWLAAPPSGLVLHWSADGDPGWSMAAPTYAIVAALTTLVLGRWIRLFVAHRTGLLFRLSGTLAAATLCVSFAGLQRFWVGGGPIFGALGLAAVVYTALVWFSPRDETQQLTAPQWEADDEYEEDGEDRGE
ncbi:hypothetical protein [Leucobacter luti]|uniref:DUF1648 domain-containing protein n=1 Tax=Leucobacter luti TaxID=340320 RepID=A0A4Q7U0C2_9MICO|nr:hypothetical protein [Leucobacter luti]MBL3698803.1 hypothetical protein [Leucobacter luti]RZT66180.1 hypothetical protein EV139_1609 [Leucobacter luti]